MSERTKPVNLKNDDIQLFEHELIKEIRETHLIELTNAYILNDIIIEPLKLKIYSVGYTQIKRLSNYSILKRILLLKNNG